MSAEEKDKNDVTSKDDQTEETGKTSSEADTSVEKKGSPFDIFTDTFGSNPSQESSATTPQPSNETINLEILNTLKAVREELKQQRDINAKLETELKEFKEEVKSNQPVQVQAIVKGHYDFTEVVKKWGHKTVSDYKAHCRSVYDRINKSIHTINDLTNGEY